MGKTALDVAENEITKELLRNASADRLRVAEQHWIAAAAIVETTFLSLYHYFIFFIFYFCSIPLSIYVSLSFYSLMFNSLFCSLLSSPAFCLPFFYSHLYNIYFLFTYFFSFLCYSVSVFFLSIFHSLAI